MLLSSLLSPDIWYALTSYPAVCSNCRVPILHSSSKYISFCCLFCFVLAFIRPTGHSTCRSSTKEAEEREGQSRGNEIDTILHVPNPDRRGAREGRPAFRLVERRQLQAREHGERRRLQVVRGKLGAGLRFSRDEPRDVQRPPTESLRRGQGGGAGRDQGAPRIMLEDGVRGAFSRGTAGPDHNIQRHHLLRVVHSSRRSDHQAHWTRHEGIPRSTHGHRRDILGGEGTMLSRFLLSFLYFVLFVVFLFLFAARTYGVNLKLPLQFAFAARQTIKEDTEDPGSTTH